MERYLGHKSDKHFDKKLYCLFYNRLLSISFKPILNVANRDVPKLLIGIYEMDNNLL